MMKSNPVNRLPVEATREVGQPSATWQQFVDRTQKTVAKYPGVSLAAAAGVGVLVGWLVKRRT